MRLFEIHASDGRIFRNQFESVADARAKLLDGYDLIGEIVTPREDKTGGFSVPLQPDPAPGDPPHSPTLMGHLLRTDGDELMAYLASNGIAPAAPAPAAPAPPPEKPKAAAPAAPTPPPPPPAAATTDAPKDTAAVPPAAAAATDGAEKA